MWMFCFENRENIMPSFIQKLPFAVFLLLVKNKKKIALFFKMKFYL
jgi:hypothetical protein